MLSDWAKEEEKHRVFKMSDLTGFDSRYSGFALTFINWGHDACIKMRRLQILLTMLKIWKWEKGQGPPWSRNKRCMQNTATMFTNMYASFHLCPFMSWKAYVVTRRAQMTHQTQLQGWACMWSTLQLHWRCILPPGDSEPVHIHFSLSCSQLWY